MRTVGEGFMIRDLHRKVVTISEIARRTGHDRKTVRKPISGSFEPAAQTRKGRMRKIDPYIPYLEARTEEGVSNAHKLYQEIHAMRYPGKQSIARAYVIPVTSQ